MVLHRLPQLPGPMRQLCWQQPPLDGTRGNPMVHCDRVRHHSGRHTWEWELDAAAGGPAGSETRKSKPLGEPPDP